jgi:hypothetical protein
MIPQAKDTQKSSKWFQFGEALVKCIISDNGFQDESWEERAANRLRDWRGQEPDSPKFW